MSSRIRSPLQNCLTPIWLSPLMCHPKCISLSPKTVVPMTYSQTTAWNTPCINYISFQFKDMLAINLELSSLSNKYSENFVFNSFGVKVSQFNQRMGHYFQFSTASKYLNYIKLAWVCSSTCTWKLEYPSAWRLRWC